MRRQVERPQSLPFIHRQRNGAELAKKLRQDQYSPFTNPPSTVTEMPFT
jgi:hypothetical protein